MSVKEDVLKELRKTINLRHVDKIDLVTAIDLTEELTRKDCKKELKRVKGLAFEIVSKANDIFNKGICKGVEQKINVDFVIDENIIKELKKELKAVKEQHEETLRKVKEDVEKIEIMKNQSGRQILIEKLLKKLEDSDNGKIRKKAKG